MWLASYTVQNCKALTKRSSNVNVVIFVTLAPATGFGQVLSLTVIDRQDLYGHMLLPCWTKSTLVGILTAAGAVARSVIAWIWKYSFNTDVHWLPQPQSSVNALETNQSAPPPLGLKTASYPHSRWSFSEDAPIAWFKLSKCKGKAPLLRLQNQSSDMHSLPTPHLCNLNIWRTDPVAEVPTDSRESFTCYHWCSFRLCNNRGSCLAAWMSVLKW